MQRHDARAALADVGQAQLLQGLERFADAAPVHAEALGQIAFGGEPLARAVLAPQDLVAELRGYLVPERVGLRHPVPFGGVGDWSDHAGQTIVV